ncbi:MAG: T9SS type A sorting domain-containing protein [Bacteroidota bacterium]|nr:T9SS type A sorting domain-containing protein [Bacteroidota bacterium]
MKYKYLHLFVLIALLPFAVWSQGPILKPSIGISSLPLDSDSICPIPVYTGDYDTSGLQAGDTIADFTFYMLNGTPVNIQTELAEGKPILLVAGNYTCPVFRDKMPALNSIYTTYGNDLKVFIINVVEAHPVVDPSPYSGTVWVTSQNQQQGVLYRQPKTYGQRKAQVDTMLSKMTILPTILLDGPCNEWWSHFGPAPNNAYLIQPNGVVFTKHAWFHRSPENMNCDIDSLFGTPCNSAPSNGNFDFALDADSFATSLPGNVIEIHSTLTNNSSSAVDIEIKRIQNNVPSGWETAMCADVCLQPWTNTFNFQIPGNSKQSFTLYFYTGNDEDSASATIQFSNMNNASNKFVQNHYANTASSASSVEEYSQKQYQIYPNPFDNELKVDFININKGTFLLRDITGKTIYFTEVNQGLKRMDVSFLKSGIYFYELNNLNSILYRGKILKK